MPDNIVAVTNPTLKKRAKFSFAFLVTTVTILSVCAVLFTIQLNKITHKVGQVEQGLIAHQQLISIYTNDLRAVKENSAKISRIEHDIKVIKDKIGL